MANPNGIGGFRKGTSGNPGGRTADEIRAARALNEALREPELIKVGIEAYKALLEGKNPAIVKDFMDRIGGKAADRIELSPAESGPMLSGLTVDELRELLKRTSPCACRASGVTQEHP